MSFKDKLSSFDQFGIFFQLSMQGNNKIYKSIFGAFISLLIYLTSLSYFTYLMYIWKQGQIIPKIARFKLLNSNERTFILQHIPFYASYEAFNNETLQLIKNKKLYDLSTQFFLNGEVIEKLNYKPECEIDKEIYFMDVFSPLCPDLKDFDQQKLTQNYQRRFYDDYLGYFMVPCNFIEDNCINNNESNIVMQSVNGEFRVSIFESDYDISNRKLKILPKDIYIKPSLNQNIVINLHLHVTEVEINKGIIFPQLETFQYISDIDIDQQISLRTEKEPYITIWINLDRIEEKIIIEDIKLSEILAQFASICQMLLICGILFNYINIRIMKSRLINEIGQIYFRDYEKLEQNQQKLKIQYSKKNQLINEIRKMLFSKYNLINILYEISKLQIAIQSILTRHQILDIQQLKYQLPDFDDLDNLNFANNYQLNLDNFKQFLLRYCTKKKKPQKFQVERQLDLQFRIDAFIKDNLEIQNVTNNYPELFKKSEQKVQIKKK